MVYLLLHGRKSSVIRYSVTHSLSAWALDACKLRIHAELCAHNAEHTRNRCGAACIIVSWDTISCRKSCKPTSSFAIIVPFAVVSNSSLMHHEKQLKPQFARSVAVALFENCCASLLRKSMLSCRRHRRLEEIVCSDKLQNIQVIMSSKRLHYPESFASSCLVTTAMPEEIPRALELLIYG